jgi:hypothetical protein
VHIIVGLLVLFFIIAAMIGKNSSSSTKTIQSVPPSPTIPTRREIVTAEDINWKDGFLDFCESPAETAFLEAMISEFVIAHVLMGRIKRIEAEVGLAG